MSLKNITDDELRLAVRASSTIVEILKKLNLTTKGSGNYRTLKNRAKVANIDLSHISLGRGHRKGKPRLGGKLTIPLEEILIKDSKYTSVTGLKKRLFEKDILKNKCSICGLEPVWQNQRLTLQLDHINGEHTDNRIENLRILCPNCHTQTLTYGSKRLKKNFKCQECGKEISNNCHHCVNCIAKINGKIGGIKQRKVKRPSKEILEKQINEFGYVGVGKLYGVSDNAIRKWMK